MILNAALVFAQTIIESLSPACRKIKIAGSVRREKPEVKDIEIICVPNVIISDLFSNNYSRDPKFISAAKLCGVIHKGKIENGKYCQIKLVQNNCEINLDLFMPNEIDFYRMFAIRTGSFEYSHNVIAKAWVKKGWRGTPDGLRLEKECYSIEDVNGKDKWVCNSKTPTLPPVWSSEKEFFSWLGIDWIEPKLRN